MPTKDQAQEMLNGTTSEWTSINGVNGAKLTSKTDTSKYIFLPAAGRYNGTSNNDTQRYAYCWTTTHRGAYYGDSSWSIMFYIRNSGQLDAFTYKCLGIPVRPIR